MGKRQKEWARRAKDQLIVDLGGACVLCGSDVELHIDHPFGRDWQPRKLEFSHRISRYRQEYKMGLVCLLCAECNEDPENKPLSREEYETQRKQAQESEAPY